MIARGWVPTRDMAVPGARVSRAHPGEAGTLLVLQYYPYVFPRKYLVVPLSAVQIANERFSSNPESAPVPEPQSAGPFSPPSRPSHTWPPERTGLPLPSLLCQCRSVARPSFETPSSGAAGEEAAERWRGWLGWLARASRLSRPEEHGRSTSVPSLTSVDSTVAPNNTHDLCMQGGGAIMATSPCRHCGEDDVDLGANGGQRPPSWSQSPPLLFSQPPPSPLGWSFVGNT